MSSSSPSSPISSSSSSSSLCSSSPSSPLYTPSSPPPIFMRTSSSCLSSPSPSRTSLQAPISSSSSSLCSPSSSPLSSSSPRCSSLSPKSALKRSKSPKSPPQSSPGHSPEDLGSPKSGLKRSKSPKSPLSSPPCSPTSTSTSTSLFVSSSYEMITSAEEEDNSQNLDTEEDASSPPSLSHSFPITKKAINETTGMNNAETHHHHKRKENCQHGWWATSEVDGHHHHKRGHSLPDHKGRDSWVTSSEKDARGIIHHHHRADTQCCNRRWAVGPPCYIGEENESFSCSHKGLKYSEHASTLSILPCFYCLSCGLVVQEARVGPLNKCLVLRRCQPFNSSPQNILALLNRVTHSKEILLYSFMIACHFVVTSSGKSVCRLSTEDIISAGIYTITELTYIEDSLGAFSVPSTSEYDETSQKEFLSWIRDAKIEFYEKLSYGMTPYQMVHKRMKQLLKSSEEAEDTTLTRKLIGSRQNFKWLFNLFAHKQIIADAFDRWKKSGYFSLRKYPVAEWEINLFLPFLSKRPETYEVDLRGTIITRIPLGLETLNQTFVKQIYLETSALKDEEFALASSHSGPEIIQYAQSLRRGGSKQVRQMKLVLVGAPAVGKTSLVRAMNGEAFAPDLISTDGIDLGIVRLDGITFRTWDFAGQQFYRYTHQLFLTSGAIYLIVCRLDEPIAVSLKEATFWVRSILSKVAQPAMILVGTHCDRLPSNEEGKLKLEEIKKTLNKVFEKHHLDFPDVAVSCVSQSSWSWAGGVSGNTEELLNVLKETAEKKLIRAPAFVEIARNAVELLELQTRNQPPMIPTSVVEGQIQVLADQLSVEWSCESLKNSLKVLHQMGHIVMLRSLKRGLDSVVVVRPSWLTGLLASIVSTRNVFLNEEGMLLHSKLSSVWSDHSVYPPERHPEMIQLLKELDVLYPVVREEKGEGEKKQHIQYFVPCLLPEYMPNIDSVWPMISDSGGNWVEYRRLVCLTDPLETSNLISTPQESSISSIAFPYGTLPRILVDLLNQDWILLSAWNTGFILRSTPLPKQKNTGSIESESGIILEKWAKIKEWGGGFMGGSASSSPPEGTDNQVQDDRYELVRFLQIGREKILIQVRCLCSSSIQRHSKILQSFNTLISLQLSDFSNLKFSIVVPHVLSDFDYPKCFFEIQEIRDAVIDGRMAFCNQDHEAPPHSLGPDLLFGGTGRPPFSREDWVVEKLIGKGSFGSVYLATLFPKERGKERINEEKEGKEKEGEEEKEEEEEEEKEERKEKRKKRSTRGKSIGREVGERFQELVGMKVAVKVLTPDETIDSELKPTKKLSREEERDELAIKLKKDISDVWAETSQEIWLLECLKHPNIVQLVGVCLGPPAILMEVVSGGELFDQLHEPIREISDVLEYGNMVVNIIGQHNMEVNITKKKSYALAPLSEIPEFILVNDSIRNWTEKIESIDEAASNSLAQATCELKKAFEAHYENPVSREDHQHLNGCLDRCSALKPSHNELYCPLDWTLRLKILYDVVSAIAYLHSQHPPVIHRDLKSPNILLTTPLAHFRQTVYAQSWEEREADLRKPLAKAADFGLSRRLFSDSLPSLQQNEGEYLNLTWFPPEVIRGEEGGCGMDIYGVGMMMWEIAARAFPFDVELTERNVPRSEPLLHVFLRQFVLSGNRPAINPDWPIAYRLLIEQCWQDQAFFRPTIHTVREALFSMSESLSPVLYKVLKEERMTELPLTEPATTPRRESGGDSELTVRLNAIVDLTKALRPEVIQENRLKKKLEEDVDPSFVVSSSSNEPVCCPSCNVTTKQRKLSQCQKCHRYLCENCIGGDIDWSESSSNFLDIMCVTCQQLAYVQSLSQDRSLSVRVQSLADACDGQEMWLGLKNGRILSLSCRESPLESAAWSFFEDSHPLSVNAIATHRFGGRDVLWTGSEDGLLKVWLTPSENPIDVVDSVRISSWIQIRTERKKWEKKWAVIESGVLQTFSSNVFGREERRWELRNLWKVQENEKEGVIRLSLTGHPPISIKSEKSLDKWKNALFKLWHALESAQSFNTRFIFSTTQRSFNGLASLGSVNGSVLVATLNSKVFEVRLAKPSLLTGLRTYAYEVQIVRDFSFSREISLSTNLVAPRPNAVLSLSDKEILVAVGSDLVMFPRVGQQKLVKTPHESQIMSMILIQFALKGRFSHVKLSSGICVRADVTVWVGDTNGKVTVWWLTPQGLPVFKETLVPTYHKSNMGADGKEEENHFEISPVSSMVFISQFGRVWIGRTNGNIEVWTIHGNYEGVLSSGASETEHSHVVTGLLWKNGVAWSGSWDESLKKWNYLGEIDVPSWITKFGASSPVFVPPSESLFSIIRKKLD